MTYTVSSGTLNLTQPNPTTEGSLQPPDPVDANIGLMAVASAHAQGGII